jgi:WD40 repeat protein
MPQDLSWSQGCSARPCALDRYRLCFGLQRQVRVQLLAYAVLTLVPHSEITIWTFEGDVVHSLSAHTSFVYTLSILPNGDVASGGEDRTLRIWRGMAPFLPDSFLTNN